MYNFQGYDYKSDLRSGNLKYLKEFFGVSCAWKDCDIFDNEYIKSVDDSGTPCFSIDKFNQILIQIRKVLNPEECQLIEKYFMSRVSFYVSHRHGSRVAFRGRSYYANFCSTGDILEIKEILKSDIIQDFNFLEKILILTNKSLIPKEIPLIVIDHLKNNILKIIYCYIEESLFGNIEFDNNLWLWMDLQVKKLWIMYLGLILDIPDIIITTISYDPFVHLIDQLEMSSFHNIKELDSVKTLLRFCYSAYELSLDKDISKFDVCVPLLYGGIELPYALYTWGCLVSKKGPLFDKIVPAVFSHKRVQKGIIPQDQIDDEGLVNNLHVVIPKILLNVPDESTALLVDNNFGTGYSIKVLAESLKKKFSKIHMAVPEVYIKGIQMMFQEVDDHWKNKALYLSKKDLYCPPVGEYITCFGLRDDSRVVNRIKFLLGNNRLAKMKGYDFDNTIMKTNSLHRIGLNRAIYQLTKQRIDVKDIAPNNTGLSWKESAKNIFIALSDCNIDLTSWSEESFAEKLCSLKEGYIFEHIGKLSLMHDVIADIRAYSVSDIQIIVSNNRLSWVIYLLEMYNLLNLFQYLICDDKAYCVNIQETLELQGCSKPSTESFLEASMHFSLPRLSTFYGDSLHTDKVFAEKVGAKFVLVE